MGIILINGRHHSGAWERRFRESHSDPRWVVWFEYHCVQLISDAMGTGIGHARRGGWEEKEGSWIGSC